MRINILKQDSFKLLLIVIATAMTSCGVGKMQSTWTKDDYKDRGYGKIAVVGIGKDLTARNTFEEDAVTFLKEKGTNAVEGVSLFPPSDKEEIRTAVDYIKIIRDNDLDGVLTMALVDANESERYEPGETLYIPSYYRVGKYIVRRYQAYDTPGYYKKSKSYLIEAVLYNVKGDLFEGKETMVWTGQSSLLDPSSLSSASETFTKRMVNQLVDDNIIQPK
ncbi:hypothetical protein [uncultured Croceitalea sp.]|uniref:hypothetical protein n=1 Tax=uncultured Croceitalea sp. TaxID=1798908 RepID=UPI0033064474